MQQELTTPTEKSLVRYLQMLVLFGKSWRNSSRLIVAILVLTLLPEKSVSQDVVTQTLESGQAIVGWVQRADKAYQTMFDDSPSLYDLSATTRDLVTQQEQILEAIKQIGLSVPNVVAQEFQQDRLRHIQAEIDDFSIWTANGDWQGGRNVAIAQSQRIESHITHVLDYGPVFLGTYSALSSILFSLNDALGRTETERVKIFSQHAEALHAWLDDDKNELVLRLDQETRSQSLLKLSGTTESKAFELGSFAYREGAQVVSGEFALRVVVVSGQPQAKVLLRQSITSVPVAEYLTSALGQSLGSLSAGEFRLHVNAENEQFTNVFSELLAENKAYSGTAENLDNAEDNIQLWATDKFAQAVEKELRMHIQSEAVHNAEYTALVDLASAVEAAIAALDSQVTDLSDSSFELARPSIIAAVQDW